MVPTLLISMMTFMSCGHRQSRQNDDLFSGMDQKQDSSVAADTNQPTDASKLAEVESKSPELTQADAVTEASPKADAAPTEDKSKTEAKADVKMDASVVEESKPSADLEIPKDGAQAKVELSTSSPDAKADVASSETTPSATSAPELMSSAATTPAPQLSDSPSVPSNTELANDAQSVAAGAPTPEVSVDTKTTEKTTEAKTEAKTVTPAKTASQKGVVAPQIPKSAIWQGNQTMNRYYFLRNGDTDESVSKLIYGNSERSTDLKKWNSGKWSAGRMILFVSKSHPEDTEMSSFYEESGIAADSYVVKSGDWLSKIAMNTYSSPGSWKEIAAVNGIESPDTISAGQTLKLYPTKLTPTTEKVAMVQNPAPAPDTTTTAFNTASDKVDHKTLDLDDEEGIIAPLPLDASKTSAKAKPAAKLASPEIGGFFAQNLTWIVAGAVAMLIFFLFSGRFRKNDSEE